MMPMVPQEVPVAKPMAQPMRKITAGRNTFRSPAPAMAFFTNTAEYIPKRVKEHRVHAKVRMRMGAIIWIKPCGTDSIDFSKEMAPRSQKYTTVNSIPIRPPKASAMPEEELEKAPTKSWKYSLSPS